MADFSLPPPSTADDVCRREPFPTAPSHPRVKASVSAGGLPGATGQASFRRVSPEWREDLALAEGPGRGRDGLLCDAPLRLGRGAAAAILAKALRGPPGVSREAASLSLGRARAVALQKRSVPAGEESGPLFLRVLWIICCVAKLRAE